MIPDYPETDPWDDQPCDEPAPPDIVAARFAGLRQTLAEAAARFNQHHEDRRTP